MGKNALINGFYEEGMKIMPSYFFDKLMVFSSKRVLHLTHKNPDCDEVASICHFFAKKTPPSIRWR
jgi:hypothetical protein